MRASKNENPFWCFDVRNLLCKYFGVRPCITYALREEGVWIWEILHIYGVPMGVEGVENLPCLCMYYMDEPLGNILEAVLSWLAIGPKYLGSITTLCGVAFLDLTYAQVRAERCGGQLTHLHYQPSHSDYGVWHVLWCNKWRIM